MLPWLRYVGPKTLPEGWHRPTRGLVEYAKLLREEGFAPMVFINPHFEPAEGSQKLTGTETCLSFPGVAATVEYWDDIYLYSDNHPPQRLKGPEAEIAQHGYWHIMGKPHVLRAIGQLYYVPREVHRPFYDRFVARNRLHKWRLIFPVAQLQAMIGKQYVLADYERYL